MAGSSATPGPARPGGPYPIADLVDRVNRCGPEGFLPAVLDSLAGSTGATGVRLLLVDVEERVLRAWGGGCPRTSPTSRWRAPTTGRPTARGR